MPRRRGAPSVAKHEDNRHGRSSRRRAPRRGPNGAGKSTRPGVTAPPKPGRASPARPGRHDVGMRDVGDLPLDGAAERAVPAGESARRAETAFADQVDADLTSGRWTKGRIAAIRLIITFLLLAPFFSGPRPSAAQVAFLAPASLILIVIVNRYVVGFARPLRPHNRASTAWLIAMVGLDWVGAVFVAGAAPGRLTRSAWEATAAGVCTAAGGLGVGLAHGVGLGGGSLELTLGPLLATFFAYTAARRSELVDTLRGTRAELARMAVADERLRIARDLHDLLGHSLSLITLKAELAGRVIGADPDRAAAEIADMETVARRSLGEVRAAVTSYRQPSLAAEIAAARQMLSAAGMDCRVHAPTPIELPPDTDALLAWTVREGTTNVVRHSGARTVTITIAVTADEAAADIADDGVGPAWQAGRGPGEPAIGERGIGEHGIGEHGSGLTGLTERARLADAQMSVRIMIAEDQTMVRQALVALLELEPDIEVVAEAAGGDEALAMARKHQPDVAVLDIEMPGPGGIEVARLLTASGFPGKIVIVTTFGRPGYLRAAMAAGASGFLLKDAPAAKLAEAIRRVMAGDRDVDTALPAAPLTEGESPLSQRETDVLAAAAGHDAIAEVAARVNLSPGTVRNHLSAAIQKLGARNRADAARIAQEKGWL